MAKVVYENPSFDKGTVLSIPGLGEIQNGVEFELTEDMKAAFEAAEGFPLDMAKDGNFKAAKKGGDE